MTDESETVAYALMASGAGERVASYVARGRKFQHHSGELLASAMVEAYRGYEGDKFARGSAWRIETDDIEAEYEIRGLQPPHDLVRVQIDGLIAAASAAFGRLTDEEIAEINEEMLADYEKLKGSEH